MHGAILLWIKKFFSARTHQTKVELFISDTAALISGVVQGSGIGLLMFLLYINELAIILDRCDNKVKLFADDVKLCLQIVNDVHVVQLQQAVDALDAWAKEWQLSISVNKCCVLYLAKSCMILASASMA